VKSLSPAPGVAVCILCSLAISLSSASAEDASQEVLQQLEAEIAAQIEQGDRSPIQVVLSRHAVARGSVTTFEGLGVSDPSLKLPDTRPEGVKSDEWKAMQNSGIEVAGAGQVSGSFQLIDVDEDGRRDLVAEITSAGASDWSTEAFVYRRLRSRFIPSGGPSSRQRLYLMDGHGDRYVRWIRVGGRVYLAHREGRYGADTLSVTRAFAAHGGSRMPGLVVRYGYEFHLPVRQVKHAPTGQDTEFLMDVKLHARLQAGLDKLGGRGALYDGDAFGKCPSPSGPSSQQETSEWPWGAGWKYFTTVAVFPVHDAGGCHAARLEFPDETDKDGPVTSAVLQFQLDPSSESSEYRVHIRRTALGVEAAECQAPWAER
jgi:hypothetical protein